MKIPGAPFWSEEGAKRLASRTPLYRRGVAATPQGVGQPRFKGEIHSFTVLWFR